VRDGLKLPHPSTTIALLVVVPAGQLELTMGSVVPPDESPLHATPSPIRSSAPKAPRKRSGRGRIGDRNREVKGVTRYELELSRQW
jgi:hypothetical protein